MVANRCVPQMFCFGIKPQQNPFEKVRSLIVTALRSNVKTQPLSADYSLFCNCRETHMKEFDGTTFWSCQSRSVSEQTIVISQL